MARLDIYTRSTNKVIDFLQVVFVFLVLYPNNVSVDAVESRHQAFIQTDKQLTYIIGDSYIDAGVPLEIKPGSSFTHEDFEDDRPLSNNMQMDPPMLVFGEQPVGMPRMEKVIVQNNSTKHSVHLLSISGSTAHFHCSFFQDKIVPPGANTTFDVVFLARQEGNVENTLYIHTSIGTLRYPVFGVGIPNPYRLRPYLGARVPINSSFTPDIHMHNPYSTRLQVLEMFASEGDLHLELPSGERDALRELWELQPFETKTVMKAKFVGRVENHHSAFIRIRTNKEVEQSAGAPELLILPIEVEVSSDPGLYSPVELLDFGILRTLDEPKTLHLNLINTGPKAIQITGISISPPNDAVSVDFRPFKLQPDGSRSTAVAQITFKAVKALHSKQWSGRIIIKTKNNNQRLTIPYQANVLHGSLVYNMNSTYFFSAKALWNITRPMVFTNTFNFSVMIYNVSFPADMVPFFTVLNFSKPIKIAPQQSVAAFLVQFHPNTTQLHFNTVLTISTNASTFNIPIIVYNGLMKVIHHRPEKFEGQLDFGTLGIGERRSMIFTIRNDNPVDIVIGQFETNMTWASVQILGMEKGKGTTLTHKHNQSEINIDPLYIKPYHYAVFNVSIVAPEMKGAYVADIWMFTQFQDLFIPIIFRAAEGSLHAIPDKFVFEKVYPGHAPHKVIQIRSTFDDLMEVTQVTFQPPDPRFYFVPHNSDTVLLQPNQLSNVGKIYFDAKRDCREDCYVGLPTFSPAGHQWLLGLSLDKDVADTDQYLYTKFYQKWGRLENLQQNIANVTIELDTTQVLGFLFSAQAHLQWPSLTRKSKIKYPLTQIGNMSVSDFIIENPGDEAVLIQALPLSLYPNPHTILDLMTQRMGADMTDYIESDETNSFVLYDLDPGASTSSSTASSVAQHRQTVEQTLGVIPHKQTVSALLKPGAKLKLKVGFQPKDDLARSSLIVIRNNLTIIDAVVIQGQGRRGEMRFNNKRPGSHSALTFEMTEKHLKNCDTSDTKTNKNVIPNFTVRRPFTLRNSGDLPFFVHGFSINDLPCEGYGFKVLDCQGFEMAPNSSKKVNIAFTPDFTMSQIQRMLTIHTSLGPPATRANYSLQAMVPYDLLSQCSAALPRPSWEPLLYYFIVCFMAFVILCILILSYFESDRIMADYIRRKLKVNNGGQIFDKGKVFDLRSVSGLSAGSSPHVHTNIATVHPGKNGNFNSSASTVTALNSCRMLTNGHVEIDRSTTSQSNEQHQFIENNRDRGGIWSSLSSKSYSSQQNNNGNNSVNLKPWHHVVAGSIWKFFKALNPQRLLTFEDKSSVISQHSDKPLTRESGTSPPSPVQKPTATVSALRQEPKVRETTPVEAIILPEKIQLDQHTMNPTSNNYSTRGRKGRLNHRRQIVVDGSGDTNNTDHLLQHKKGRHQKESKDYKDSSPANYGNVSTKRNSMSMLDDFDDFYTRSSLAAVTGDIDDIDLKSDMTSNKQGKRIPKRNKYKPQIDDSSKDRQLLRRDSSFADDGDDVSSTTTESSGGDSEEKIPLGGEASSELINNARQAAARKGKKGGKQNERMVVATYGADSIDDESNFEVTSKSKAHRKVRVNKEMFGGDIMIPSTIELPYCLPKEKEQAENEKSKRSKKSKKSNQKIKDLPIPVTNCSIIDGTELTWDALSIGRESPPPAWDAESTQSDSLLLPGFFLKQIFLGDLSELSLQTETFAQKHIPGQASGLSSSRGSMALPTPPGLSPFGSTLGGTSGASFSPMGTAGGAGGRSISSYSSIVSSNAQPGSVNNGNNTGTVNSNPPTGLSTRADNSGRLSSATAAPPGITPYTSAVSGGASAFGSVGYGPFSDTSLHGMMHQGLNHPPPTVRSSWSTGPPPAGELNPNYGMRRMDDPSAFMSGPMDGYMFGAPADQPQLTMMQQLQYERRRRFYEHQKKVNKGEDWPGFSNPPTRTDSLWDPDYNPLEYNTWSSAADTTPGGFWSTLTNSASSGWSSLQSLANIWGSNNTNSSTAGTVTQVDSNRASSTSSFSQAGGAGSARVQTSTHQLNSAAPPFNPFTSMADIWSPSSLASDASIETSNTQAQWRPGPIGSQPSFSPGNPPPVSKEE